MDPSDTSPLQEGLNLAPLLQAPTAPSFFLHAGQPNDPEAPRIEVELGPAPLDGYTTRLSVTLRPPKAFGPNAQPLHLSVLLTAEQTVSMRHTLEELLRYKKP